MAFRPIPRVSPKYPSPEALFADLKGRKVLGLLSHQADVLRSYQETALEEPDVAFQMPTGSGKTLVGILLGEWRRRNRRERILYLCPTQQLAYQVASEANAKYDIKVHALVGSKRDFPVDQKAAYMAGEAIAVTTYSGLFNINPAFDDPQVIILDDAHAAENYVADHWSVTVDKTDASLWAALAALLRNYLHPLDHKRLVSEAHWPADAYWADKLPTPVLAEASPALTAILDEHLTREHPAHFAWGVIRNHLLVDKI